MARGLESNQYWAFDAVVSGLGHGICVVGCVCVCVYVFGECVAPTYSCKFMPKSHPQFCCIIAMVLTYATGART